MQLGARYPGPGRGGSCGKSADSALTMSWLTEILYNNINDLYRFTRSISMNEATPLSVLHVIRLKTAKSERIRKCSENISGNFSYIVS
jgi:hypothetical protein